MKVTNGTLCSVSLSISVQLENHSLQWMHTLYSWWHKSFSGWWIKSIFSFKIHGTPNEKKLLKEKIKTVFMYSLATFTQWPNIWFVSYFVTDKTSWNFDSWFSRGFSDSQTCKTMSLCVPGSGCRFYWVLFTRQIKKYKSCNEVEHAQIVKIKTLWKRMQQCQDE